MFATNWSVINCVTPSGTGPWYEGTLPRLSTTHLLP